MAAYPALINDGALTDKMYALAQELLGQEQAVQIKEASLGADDFAFFSQQVPGCYFNVGARTAGLTGQTLHCPAVVLNEDSMETAILLLTAGALACLS